MLIESVQDVRKSVQQTLSPRAKACLKANYRLLNPPVESLVEESRERLEMLLNYSLLLRSVREWKEAFTTWYDCSPNYAIANLDLYVDASKAIRSTTAPFEVP